MIKQCYKKIGEEKNSRNPEFITFFDSKKCKGLSLKFALVFFFFPPLFVARTHAGVFLPPLIRAAKSLPEGIS